MIEGDEIFMWIITDKEDNAIFGFSDTIKQYDSGYSKLNSFGFVIKESDWGVYSVQEIPEGVVSGKYCYTEEKGFYENPNWVEPVESDPTNTYGIPDELYYKIKEQAVQEVKQEVILNAN